MANAENRCGGRVRSADEQKLADETYARGFRLQKAVLRFPQGVTPIVLVSASGAECSVRFLHQKGGFFVDLPDEAKGTWQLVVDDWLSANPVAKLEQNGISVDI